MDDKQGVDRLKRWITTILLALVFGSSVSAASEAVGMKPRVIVDGITLTTSELPAQPSKNPMVPFHDVARALNLSWDKQDTTITATRWGITAVFQIGETAAKINDVAWTLDAPPALQGKTIMVPLSLFTKAFGVDVTWNPTLQRAELSTKRQVEMFVFYASGSYPHRYDLEYFDQVAMAWSKIDTNGTLRLDLPHQMHKWPRSGAEQFLADLKAKGQPRYLNVYAFEPNCRIESHKEGTPDSWLGELLADSVRRLQLAEQVVAVIKDKGFDGVILNLEEMGCYGSPEKTRQAREGYTAFVQALSPRLRLHGLKMGIALHPPSEHYNGYDHKALAQKADFVILMAHDFDKPSVDDPEPLNRVEKAVRDLKALGVPNQKTLLATVLSYETPETLVEKAVLAKRYNLRGVSVWYLAHLSVKHLLSLFDVIQPLTDQY